MSVFNTIKISELVESGEASLQTGPFGTQLKASDYAEHGTPVINVRNVGFGDIRQKNLEFLDDKMVEKLLVHKLESGDIVFGRKGAVERHALITDIGKGWIQGSDCLRLRINSERIDNRFISCYLRTQTHQDWMIAVCSFGATMASLNQDIVKLITVPLPPIELQQKIAAVLSAYDDLIENNKRRIAALEKMAEEIYREWFVRFRFPDYQTAEFEKGIPQNWKPIHVDKAVQRISVGKRYEQKTIFNDGKVPVLDQGQTGIIGYHNDEPGVMASFDEPVIVFANHTCYQKLIFNPFSTIQNVLPFIPSDEWPTSTIWLHYATTRLINFSEYKGHWPEFVSKQLLYPGEELTFEFENVVKPILSQIEAIGGMSNSLLKIRDLLLPRLISGKLSVDELDIHFPPSMQDMPEVDVAE